MAKAIRVGLVGAGFAARFHWKGYRKVHGVPISLSGVTSKSEGSRKAFAEEYGVEAFETFEAL
jgi:predicted dehydrogenase